MPILVTSHIKSLEAAVIVVVELTIHFAATSWPTTSWGMVECQRYYSKGYWDEIIPPIRVIQPRENHRIHSDKDPGPGLTDMS